MAKIVLGDWEETFPLFSDIWDERQFTAHWLASLDALLAASGNEEAALVTEVYDARTNSAVRWWALYRVGRDVWVREQLVARDELPSNFEPERASEFVRPRGHAGDPGSPISEWRVSVEDLERFVFSRRA